MERHILIVDDDLLYIDFITTILHNEGYTTHYALDSTNVVDTILRINPNLVIMDWEMPEMNGIEAIKKIKQNQRIAQIPIILVTGKTIENEDIRTAFNAGASDYIRKPVEPIELLTRANYLISYINHNREILQQKDQELINLSKINYQNEVFFKDIKDAIGLVNTKCNESEKNIFYPINQKIESIHSTFKNKSWARYDEYFKKIHPYFAENLLKTYPDLTPEELKLCHFLRMNMSTKEIAIISNKERHSVDVGRYRLRKKMNLTRNQKLSEILSHF